MTRTPVIGHQLPVRHGFFLCELLYVLTVYLGQEKLLHMFISLL